MKIIPSNYAKAFWIEYENTEPKFRDELFSNFAKVISRNGDIVNSSRILDEIKNLHTKKTGGRLIKIEVAREMKEAELRSLKNSFDDKDDIEVFITPSLIAGVRITINGEQEIDNTIARKVARMFN